VEKMTLFWHDHFATLDQDTPLMLEQNKKLRRRALGSFRSLLRTVTLDPAMQLFLSLANSHRDAPNENYARELMELFTLGKGYTERDIREAARALTGFTARWSGGRFRGIGYDRHAHDEGVKRIFGRKGRFDWRDVLELVLRHPRHPAFLVEKLWAFFVSAPLDRGTRRQLVRIYTRSRLEIKPVVGAILAHPALYAELDRPDMVKSPVVYVAGALRATGRGVDTGDWAWMLGAMAQQPFRPPSVAGWDWGPAWLSTDTMRARFIFATHLLRHPSLAVADLSTPIDMSPGEQLAQARRAVGEPWTAPETAAELERMAAGFFAGLPPRDPSKQWTVRQWQRRADACQRVLRHFLLSGPDAHLH
jgi:uncharacterized protein (DUF1800 family)